MAMAAWAPSMPRAPRRAAAMPPPTPPATAVSAVCAQLTEPVVAFWMMVSAPAPIRPRPMGPPIPVYIRRPPAMIIPAPAMYSQLWANQSPVAARAPLFPSR
ncbi:hypothetical protein C5C45_15860 [Rathayibacter rathayi]|uniref:Uncharacterized protein n=1 Tax=Rathayibacter rathayi TaxID=33887 RepID=A0ABD6W4Y5_RATRA|nr:hypothetical protein C5C04_14785 [Rathayibacter rathayi]PPF41691.1 hypothetical protein C5C08_15885 [Rathayibacter rathayi]PPF73314.1 hypothetical protein C5C14_15755 [Rathayibacter rathayi]PPG07493.1 hypothetical protein C5C11_16085 [Rathayibacter rathayi]PPG35652.1 hypothetical protein C5C20_15950 [Rathayibacter rathayi]